MYVRILFLQSNTVHILVRSIFAHMLHNGCGFASIDSAIIHNLGFI